MSLPTSLCRVYWDFYGPMALGTAQHFERHLGALLEREGLAGAVRARGVQQLNPTWAAAWCEGPLEEARKVGQALRARRAELVEEAP